MKKRRSKKQESAWVSAAARRLQALAGGSVSVEDAVIIVANRLLEDIECPPSNLEKVQTRLNITQVSPEDLPIAAELRHGPDGYMIAYSSFSSPERSRFSIAHEMAHVVFESTGPNPPRSGRELERLCDKIATELLLPQDVFRQLAGPHPSLQRVFELARIFKTSLSATMIRCCELGHASAFEVENGQIVWFRGGVRSLTGDIGAAVEVAMLGRRVDTVMPLHRHGLPGFWRVEGIPIGQEHRAVFLLQPAPPKSK